MALKKTPSPEIGACAADFELLGTDGEYHSLADVRGNNGTLVMFICNHCPYVQAVLERLVADCLRLEEMGVGCAAVMSNDPADYPEDSYENMQRLALARNFPFPYLWDDTQEVARKYGAVCTPDFFGYNRDLELQYRGRLDAAAREPTRGDLPSELVKAFEQIIETGAGPDEQQPSMGCSIKWKEDH